RVVAYTAFPGEAAAFDPARIHRGRNHRPVTRGACLGGEDLEGFPRRPNLYATFQARDDRASWVPRRSALGRLQLRSKAKPAFRELGREYESTRYRRGVRQKLSVPNQATDPALRFRRLPGDQATLGLHDGD